MAETVRKRKELKIDCVQDPGTPATFICTRCKRPFCEDCVGAEDRQKVYCIECAAVVEVKVAKKKSDSLATKAKSVYSSPRFIAMALLFSSLLLVYVYVGVNAPETIRVREPFPQRTAEQEGDLLKCEENMEALSMLLENFQATNNRNPERLENIVSQNDSGFLQEPVTGRQYGLEMRTETGLVVACPNPEEHNLYDLFVVPGQLSTRVGD